MAEEKISPELKTALDGLESTFTTAQNELDVKLKKLGEDSADYQEYKAKAVQDMVEVTKSIDEIKAAIARAPAAGAEEKKELSKEHKAFRAHLKHGTEGMNTHELKADLSVSDNERGGFLVLPEIGAMIDQLQREVSPMRQLVNVITINSGDAIESPTTTNKTAGATWRNETTTSTDNSDIKWGNKRITVNWLDAVIPATQQLSDDVMGLESMLAQFAAEDFAITEGAAIINGTGVGQARGLLTYDAADISQVNSGAAAAFTTTGVLDLVGSLKTAYRTGSSFIANRSTIFTELFGLQDGEDRHYLVPDFRNGFQFTLLGFPLHEMPDMPDTAAGALPLAFGNFRRAYNWVERKQLSLFVDPYTRRPFTEFIWSKRSGGDVVVQEALKIQKISA
jgi:HK97 family phage major capsid protein